MMRSRYFLLLFLVFMLACTTLSAPIISAVTPLPPSSENVPTQAAADLTPLQNSALVDFYDPARNPAEDLKQAIPIAQKEKKRILLELGGNWCIWCRHMDDFYKAHRDLLQFRAEHYILVKVNVSEENQNQEFLSQYPAAPGYPHIYILESDGTLLHSQDTSALEDGGDSYVLDVFMSFLRKWASLGK